MMYEKNTARGLTREIPGIEPIFKPRATGLDKAMDFMGKSQGMAGAMQPNIPNPGKTAGGGLTSGLAGAGAGASIGTAVSTAAMAGPVGAGIGAAVGIAGYYLS